MFKFNYSKMNRVIENLKINLAKEELNENKVLLIGGAILYFDGALDKADNLDNKLKEDYINYFYREAFDVAMYTNNLMIAEPVADFMIKSLNKKLGKKKNNPYFNLMIDIFMLIALSFVQANIMEGAKDYFSKAISLGDKYINESKKNYHDSLCCAYNWLGYINKTEENYKDALALYEKTYELYNSVKDEEGFYYNEYDPKDVNDNIEEIKKILNS